MRNYPWLADAALTHDTAQRFRILLSPICVVYRHPLCIIGTHAITSHQDIVSRFIPRGARRCVAVARRPAAVV